MKKIITFLGERGAMATTYRFAGKDYAGGVFAEALRQFCPFDQMLVCVTEKAAQKTWPVLAALDDERIKPVPIRTGETTAEMWETFKSITDQVDEGDTVTFDITHGLRSLPFLVFLFAAYLKAAKGVTIDAIYYGALELGDSKNGVPAPVIDLSEFTSMLDWITATDRFIQTGAGDALSDLLLARLPSSLAMRNDLLQREVGRRLKDVAVVIDQISLALSITRPLETMQAAARLAGALMAAQSALDERAQPFGVLANKVRAAYAPFALTDPTAMAMLKRNLWIQVDMVAWYIDKRQFVQAATLAREVVVSLVICCLGQIDLVDLQMRMAVETAINNLAESRKPNPRPPREASVFDAPVSSMANAIDIATVWNKLASLRNDIAHVGMRRKAETAIDLSHTVTKLQPDLEMLALKLIGPRDS